MNSFIISVFISLCVINICICEYYSVKTQKYINLANANEFTKNISNDMQNETTYGESFFTGINLKSYYDIQYYGDIYLGSNDQKVSVIFDTGSNMLWVPSSNCTNLNPNTNTYDPSLSWTSVKLDESLNITYAIGYVEGNIYKDSVSINKHKDFLKSDLVDVEKTAENMRFLVASIEENLTTTIADGVLGLGIDTEGNSQNSFVYSLYKQGEISEPSFSFYIGNMYNRLYFGDILENEYMKNLLINQSACDVPYGSKYWQCKIGKGITLSNGERKISFQSKSNVIFDSGTSYIIVPNKDMDYIMNYLNSFNNDGCALSNYYQLICTCESKEQFGMMSFNISYSSNFEIYFKNIIDYYPELQYQCRFQMMIDVYDINTWILGDSALRDNLISFDMNHRQIKWANISKLLDEQEIVKSIYKENQNSRYLIKGFIYVGVVLGIVGVVLYFIH